MTNGLDFLKHFGVCAPQPASDWQGPMPLPPALIEFYQEMGPLGEDGRKPRGVSFDCGGNDILVPRLADLWKEQDAFGWNFRKNVPIEGWPPSWLVFAVEGADAFIYDSDADAVRFILSGDEIKRAYKIAGAPSDVVGALALFALRLEEAGDSARGEDWELRRLWVWKVRREMKAKFGRTARGVVKVLTKV